MCCMDLRIFVHILRIFMGASGSVQFLLVMYLIPGALVTRVFAAVLLPIQLKMQTAGQIF